LPLPLFDIEFNISDCGLT